MAKINLNPEDLQELRTINPRLIHLARALGEAYLVINTSWDESLTVGLPGEAEVYALTGNGKLRSRTMLLNGEELKLGEGDAIPEMKGVKASGSVEVVPGGCTFIVM